ncbi:MAG: EAL domain-containing protein [Candidatus Bruticola sp.]
MTNSILNRILVAEDQGVSRMLICHYLEGSGFEAIAVDKCSEALKIIEDKTADVFILETLAKDINGLNFIKELRSRWNLAELPIIVVSSLGEYSDKVAAWTAGANYYIIKPTGKEELEAKVKLCLSLKNSYEQLRLQEERLNLAVKAINGGVFDWDIKNNSIINSPRVYELLCLEHDLNSPASPQDWFNAIHPEDYASVSEKLKEHLEGKTPYLEVQHRVMRQDGTHRWVLVRAIAVRNSSGEAQRLVGNISDISNSFSYDSVTGLPGRHVFYDLLERAMVRAIRNEKYLFGLLNVTINDLDKQDTKFTNAEIEQIWSTVSRRLQLSSRASDLVSRVEQNSFAILLDDLREVSDALRVANRISKSLSSPMRIFDNQINVNTSIGIAVSCDGYESPESLLNDACKASLLAKTLGENKARMCNEKHQKYSQERLAREQELYDAIGGRQFIPRYLPIINREDNSVIGIEVLLRWRHPNGATLLPDEFLDLCDRDQLILPIGYELIKSSLEQMKKLNSFAPLPENFTINFNVCKRQFFDSDLLDNILLSCQDYQFAAHRIRLEVCEETLAQDINMSKQIIDLLDQHGIGCVLDRFGSTALSLCDMLNLNLKGVKSHYLDISSPERSRKVKERYAQMCQKAAEFLNCSCIINGAANQEEADHLFSVGLKLQEGYALGQPLNLSGLEILAENGYKLK